jgi:hypothetical protein
MSTKPKLNDKLINCVLEHIEHEVEKGSGAYDQNLWANIRTRGAQVLKCGTTGCFAGWACMLSTPREEWYEKFGLHKGWSNDVFNWADNAAEKLGLEEDEANYLFDSCSGSKRFQLEKVKERLENIREARERGVYLSDVVNEKGRTHA